MDKNIIRQTPIAETKASGDGEQRALIVTISTPTPDRSGDIVVPKGGELDNFRKNPVVLFGHSYSDLPIARAEELTVNEDSIQARVIFPKKGLYAFADTIYDLYKEKILSAWSIGFIPKESVNLDPEKPWGAKKFTKWEMLEFSAVPVPANPEALTLLRSQGIEESVIKHLTTDAAETKEAQTEEKETPEAVPEALEGTGLSYDSAAKRLTISHEKGSIAYTITEEQLNTFSAAAIATEKTAAAEQEAAKAADITKTLTALREALKPADKEIGLVLRNLKSLLAKPNPEGGE